MRTDRSLRTRMRRARGAPIAGPAGPGMCPVAALTRGDEARSHHAQTSPERARCAVPTRSAERASAQVDRPDPRMRCGAADLLRVHGDTYRCATAYARPRPTVRRRVRAVRRATAADRQGSRYATTRLSSAVSA